MDSLKAVDKGIRTILKKNPNFRPKEGVQSEDFYKHVRQFKVIPLFGIGAKAAANLPFFPITKTYSILDSVDYNVPYSSSVGYSVGGKIEIEPLLNLSLTVELMATGVSYSRTLKKPTEWNMFYEESMSYIEVPVFVKKSFAIKDKWFPYIIAGAGWLQISKSFAGLSIKYSAVDPLTSIKEDSKLAANQVNQRGLRSTDNYEWLTGLGFTYKLKSFRFSADVRYYGGLTNLINTSARYGNADLIYQYNYVDLKHTIKKMKDAKF